MSPVSRQPPEIAVIGPGAVGATIAAELARAGHELLLCGRTERRAIVVERAGHAAVTLGPVRTDPAGLRPVRWLLLAVKAHQTHGAAGWLSALADSETTVLVLQNGVDQRDLVSPLVPTATVVPSVVWFSAESVSADRMLVHNEPRLTLPDDPGGRAVSALLADTGCVVEVAADYELRAWRKLTQNAVAGLTVLAGRRLGIFRRADIAVLARAYAAEIMAVAGALGVELDPRTPDDVADGFAALPAEHGSSITRDREQGHPLEWEARNEVIRRHGAALGVPTPISDVVVPLLAAASDGWTSRPSCDVDLTPAS
jgi:2-dehydropantoate 2-reductase